MRHRPKPQSGVGLAEEAKVEGGIIRAQPLFHFYNYLLIDLYMKYIRPPYSTVDPNISIIIADNGTVILPPFFLLFS